MTIRLKFWGTPRSITQHTRDDGSFKESEHPRAANGQFTSGGGASGKQIHGGVTVPKKGTVAHQIWVYSAMCEEQGIAVNAKNVSEMAKSKGAEINFSSIQQTMSPYKKYQAAAKEAGKGQMTAQGAQPEAPKAEAPKPAPVQLKNDALTYNALAKEAGFTLEGNFSGLTYYIAENGKKKVSYDPNKGTWQLKEPDGTVTKGDDLNKLAEKLKVDPAATQKAAGEQPAKAAAEQAAKEAAEKAKKEAAHSTLNAALYGHKGAVKGEHKFTSKGAATEEAFAPAIRQSITAYRGSYYQSINKAMRFDADYSSTDPQTMRHVLHLQRAFKLAPPTTQDIQVGRKVQTEALKTMAKDAGLSSLKELAPGQVLRDEGVISTSHSAGVWSGSVKFDITVPKGSKAIDLSETINKAEAELMLPPGSGLKIKEVKHNHKGHDFYIICEHVA